MQAAAFTSQMAARASRQSASTVSEHQVGSETFPRSSSHSVDHLLQLEVADDFGTISSERAYVGARLSVCLAFPTLACRCLRLIMRQWFFVGLGLVIGAGKAYPDLAKTGGLLRGEWTLRYGATIVIFILSGAGLQASALKEATRAWRLHVFTQTLSLAVLPCVGRVVTLALSSAFPAFSALLLKGILVTCCTSTTASTTVVFTRAAGGNEPLALINSVTGNVLGVFISPLWLRLFLSSSGQPAFSTTIIQLLETVVGPLIIGQALAYFFPMAVAGVRQRLDFGKATSLMILLLVWTTFSTYFVSEEKVRTAALVALIFFMLLLFLFVSAVSVGVSLSKPVQSMLHSNDADAVAMQYCVSTKSIVGGVAVIAAVFGHGPDAALVTLPLLVYYCWQTALGNLLISPLKTLLARRRSALDSASLMEVSIVGGHDRLGKARIARSTLTKHRSHHALELFGKDSWTWPPIADKVHRRHHRHMGKPRESTTDPLRKPLHSARPTSLRRRTPVFPTSESDK